MLHGAHHSFGLGEWDIGPISLSPSVSIIKKYLSCIHQSYKGNQVNLNILFFKCTWFEILN